METQFTIALLSTGGTIEKTYDESEGVLANGISVLDTMLCSLQLDGVSINRVNLMNKDSLDMTDEDHEKIADEVAKQAIHHDGVIVIHGTDRLSVTGEKIYKKYPELQVPCVLTGAMRPWIMKNTDALQNLVESFAVVQLLQAGVYIAMHNIVLQFPCVTKDKTEMRFVKKASQYIVK
ncbi:MAG: asparaginase [Phycisphaerae bacterium]|nr:asparaginase [Phycisphaerae bacterium]